MKSRTWLSIVYTILVTTVGSTFSEMHLEPNKNHYTFGVGLVVDQLPVSTADFWAPLSYYAYEHQFNDPLETFRGGMELGVFGFNAIIPVPEFGANMYIGGEDRSIQGKIGLSGFYDPFVGGHAGLCTRFGIVASNRFDIGFIVVPVGIDSKRSYSEAMGLSSKEEADEFYKEHGQHVIMPYFGMLFGFRY